MCKIKTLQFLINFMEEFWFCFKCLLGVWDNIIFPILIKTPLGLSVLTEHYADLRLLEEFYPKDGCQIKPHNLYQWQNFKKKNWRDPYMICFLTWACGRFCGIKEHEDEVASLWYIWRIGLIQECLQIVTRISIWW